MKDTERTSVEKDEDAVAVEDVVVSDTKPMEDFDEEEPEKGKKKCCVLL